MQKKPSDLLSKRFESSGSILLGPQKKFTWQSGKHRENWPFFTNPRKMTRKKTQKHWPFQMKLAMTMKWMWSWHVMADVRSTSCRFLHHRRAISGTPDGMRGPPAAPKELAAASSLAGSATYLALPTWRFPWLAPQ